MHGTTRTAPTNLSRMGAGLAASLAIGLAAVAATAPANAAEKVILILDSSGSMAGKIKGERKIDIARKAVDNLVSTMQPGTELGVMAYGHRRKDDCTDIQTIAGVSKPNRQNIMRSVNALRPIGKTPLGKTVLMAAEKLNFTEEKATVILVSDGKENCGVDPCELGRSLAGQGINFKTHVIGFNLKLGEEAGLRCLAKNNGGMYVPARDPQSLQKALTVTVKEAAAPAPAKPKKIAALSGLKVRAFIKAGGEEWKGQLGIKLFGPPQGLDGKRPKVADAWRKKSGYIFKGVKAGRYLMQVVLADHRHILKSREIEVRGGAGQVEDVILNIGQVRFDYSLSEGGKPFTWQAGWNVFGKPEGLDGKRKKIAGFWRKKSGSTFWLPAGEWLVGGVIADARYMTVKKNIVVQPGSAELHSFNFNGGLVRFDAKLSEEGAPFKGQLGWNVFGKPQGLDGKRKKIAGFWRKKSGSIFVLPAGEWLVGGVLADHRQVQLSSQIKVEPGSERLHKFNFKAGVVRFDVTVAGQPTKDQLGLNVFSGKPDLAGKRKKIAGFWRKRSGHIAILPEGDYALNGMLANQRDVTGASKFQVTAGDEKPVALNLQKQ